MAPSATALFRLAFLLLERTVNSMKSKQHKDSRLPSGAGSVDCQSVARKTALDLFEEVLVISEATNEENVLGGSVRCYYERFSTGTHADRFTRVSTHFTNSVNDAINGRINE